MQSLLVDWWGARIGPEKQSQFWNDSNGQCTCLISSVRMCVTSCSHVKVDDPGACRNRKKRCREAGVWSIWKSRTHVRGTHFFLFYISLVVCDVCFSVFSDIYIWTACRTCACDGRVCMVCACVRVCVFSDSDWGIDRFPSQVIIVFYSALILYACLCVCLYVRVWFLGGVGSTGLWLALGSVLSLLQVLLVSAGLSQTLQSPLMQILQIPPQLVSLPLFLQLPKGRRGKRDRDECKKALDKDTTKILSVLAEIHVKSSWNQNSFSLLIHNPGLIGACLIPENQIIEKILN